MLYIYFFILFPIYYMALLAANTHRCLLLFIVGQKCVSDETGAIQIWWGGVVGWAGDYE